MIAETTIAKRMATMINGATMITETTFARRMTTMMSGTTIVKRMTTMIAQQLLKERQHMKTAATIAK